MGIKVIITGATGMVGEGVLHACLQSPTVEQILLVSRKSYGLQHPKLLEIIHSDFFDLSPIQHQLSGYDGCFFCLGVSSLGMKEEEYYQKTYVLTMYFAQTVSTLNPAMTFCYISGSGTDSSEKGGSMWARIKGKTENDLMKLPFKKAFMFRPGFMKSSEGMKNTLPFYKYVAWMYPLFRKVAPNWVCTLAEVGQAMIHTVTLGYEKNLLEVKDIVELSRRK